MSMEEIVIEFLLLLVICAGSCLVYVLCIVTVHLGEIDTDALLNKLISIALSICLWLYSPFWTLAALSVS
jgi:hypothetical protein